jgi:uncharacterized membrane protein HdeD (DUF308 family)
MPMSAPRRGKYGLVRDRAALLIIWVGLLALFRGITEIVLAFELKSAQHR